MQKVKGEQTTFGDVATAVLQMVLREGKDSNRIDVVLTHTKKIQSKTVRGCCEGKRLVISFRALLVHRS